jgi:hypothetical protein
LLLKIRDHIHRQAISFQPSAISRSVFNFPRIFRSLLLRKFVTIFIDMLSAFSRQPSANPFTALHALDGHAATADNSAL